MDDALATTAQRREPWFWRAVGWSALGLLAGVASLLALVPFDNLFVLLIAPAMAVSAGFLVAGWHRMLFGALFVAGWWAGNAAAFGGVVAVLFVRYYL